MKKPIVLLSAASIIICCIYIKKAFNNEVAQSNFGSVHEHSIFTPFYENVAWTIIEKTPYSRIYEGSKFYLFDGVRPFVDPVKIKLRKEALSILDQRDVVFGYCRKTAVDTKENLEMLRNDLLRAAPRYR